MRSSFDWTVDLLLFQQQQQDRETPHTCIHKYILNFKLNATIMRIVFCFDWIKGIVLGFQTMQFWEMKDLINNKSFFV